MEYPTSTCAGLQPADLRQICPHFPKVSLKVAPQTVENLAQCPVSQRVEDLVAFLAGDNDPFGSQYAQVLGGIGLFQFQQLDNLAGREFTVPKRFGHGDPGGMSQGLKNTGLEISQCVCFGHKTVYSEIRIFAIYFYLCRSAGLLLLCIIFFNTLDMQPKGCIY